MSGFLLKQTIILTYGNKAPGMWKRETVTLSPTKANNLPTAAGGVALKKRVNIDFG